jgi:putative membrane protein
MSPTSLTPFDTRARYALLAFVGLVLVWSGVGAKDPFTWVLEVVPVFVGVALVLARHRAYPLTLLLSTLLALHAAVLCVGGHWTYAEVPAGFWVRDALHLTRNPYDRLGHLMQGFVPALLAREIFLRSSPLRRGGWLFLCVTSVCLAFSACYELIEWWTALSTGEAAEAFLGTQGDPWDTQWDMFCALLGALTAQLTLARWHDRQLRALVPSLLE